MSVYANELLSSSSLTSYPFRDDAGVPVRVYRLFCDAVVSIPHGFGFSASISNIEVAPTGMSFVLDVCGDRTSMLVPVTDRSYYVARFGDFSSVVADIDHIRDSEPFFDPSEYPLVESCANFLPRAVDSISLMKIVEKGEEPVMVKSGIRGEVVFVDGTNSNVVATDTGIEFNAVPGAGTGRVPCDCPDPDEKGTVPSIVPESTGDVVIDGDGCIQVNTDNSSTVTIEGRCTACCPTSKYAEQLDKLAELKDSVSSIYGDAIEFTDDYNEFVTEFNEFLEEPVEEELMASMTAVAAIPRERAPEWRRNGPKGYHQLVYANTTIVNASQKEVSVSIGAPSCRGLEVASTKVSPGVRMSGQTVPKREVENGVGDFSLPPGGSISVYSVLRGSILVLFIPDSTYDVTQDIVFSWEGKELVDGVVRTVQKTVTRELSAECSVTRGQ